MGSGRAYLSYRPLRTPKAATFAGIAFLWFSVFCATASVTWKTSSFPPCFFGSGLLYLVMTFVFATITGGLVTLYVVAPEIFIESGILILAGQSFISSITPMPSLWLGCSCLFWVPSGCAPV